MPNKKQKQRQKAKKRQRQKEKQQEREQEYISKTTNNNKKSKNRKNRKKNKHKKNEIDEKFIEELKNLGYFIREVGGDGNCLFRSVSEQAENDENNYKYYREKCIEYMKNNKDNFIPFIEDDEPFEKYIERMSEDGVWGGNLEIYAMSMEFKFNFYIYIHERPIYIVNNWEKPKKNILLTYHDGEHYNSLRKLEEKNKNDEEKEKANKNKKKDDNDSNSDNENSEDSDSEDVNDVNDLISKVEHLNI